MGASLESGDMTRRGFFSRAGELAACGLTATVIVDGLSTAALAQQRRKVIGRRPQRVVVIGVDHYHATSTPNYLRILQNECLNRIGRGEPPPARPATALAPCR